MGHPALNDRSHRRLGQGLRARPDVRLGGQSPSARGGNFSAKATSIDWSDIAERSEHDEDVLRGADLRA
jgi:hypothetical protein